MMFMQPILRQDVSQPETDVSSRAVGSIVLPIALATLAMWIVAGCFMVLASVSVWHLSKAFRAITGMVGYTDTVALGR